MKKKIYGGEVGKLHGLSYSMIDRGDGPRCAWCDKKNPTRKHLEKCSTKAKKKKKSSSLIVPRPPRKMKCGCVKFYKDGKWFVKWPCEKHSPKG